jgi:formate C-acetyltransferase
MKPVWGDDYSICCCVSATQTGKEMQFFGARANLAKCLLYAINGGVDEKNGKQVGPAYRRITSEYLDYDEVMERFDKMMDWLAGLYVNILNLIQYMHDKYYYEAAEMALIDTDVRRTFATGIAGFSHVIDSLSAINTRRLRSSATRTALRRTMKSRATSPDTEMTMTERMKSAYGFCMSSSPRSGNTILTVIRSRQLRF